MTGENDFTCKECGRTFESLQALGGHASVHHRKEGEADLPAQPVAEDSSDAPSAGEQQPATGSGDEESEAAQINKLLDEGYTFGQIRGQFGFKEGTIRQEIKKRIPPEKAANDIVADNHMLPTLLKGSEIISPEGIIQHCLDDGSRDWQLRVEGMMLLRAAQRMNLDDMEIAKGQADVHAKMMKPVLDTMIEISREQDAAARRAMGANEEVAYRAATDVARQLAPEIQSLRSQITAGSAPDPATRMMNMMQSIPRMLQMGQQVMGMMGMPMGPSPQGGPMGGQPQIGLQPGGVGEATEDEVKEAFGG